MRRIAIVLLSVSMLAAACSGDEPVTFNGEIVEPEEDSLSIADARESGGTTTTEASAPAETAAAAPPTPNLTVLSDVEVTRSDGSTYEVKVEIGAVSAFGTNPEWERVFSICALDQQRDGYIPVVITLTNTTSGFDVDTKYNVKFEGIDGRINSQFLNFGDESGCAEGAQFPGYRAESNIWYNGLSPNSSKRVVAGLVLSSIFTPANPGGDLASLTGNISYEFGERVNGQGLFANGNAEGILPIS